MPPTGSDDEAKTLNEEADPAMTSSGGKAFQAEGVQRPCGGKELDKP